MDPGELQRMVNEMALSLDMEREGLVDSFVSNIGLVKGVDLNKDDGWYTADLTRSPPLFGKGYFYLAAALDARDRNLSVDGYLSGQESNLTTLVNNNDTVFDREVLRGAVRKNLTRPGSLSFLMGPQSTGKTKMMNEFVSSYNAQVFANSHVSTGNELMIVYVNGRAAGIADGIKIALAELQKKSVFHGIQWAKIVEKFATASKAVTKKHPIKELGVQATACGISEVFSLLTEESRMEVPNLMDLIKTLAAEKNKTACLIVDEANAILQPQGDDSRKTLEKIVDLTKVRGEMSVLLCTSVHSYPDALATGLNMQLNHTHAIYAEELSPGVMWHILTESTDDSNMKLVGMGERLARLCIAVCGGNLLRVKKLVELLSQSKKKFLARFIFDGLEGADEVAGLMETEQKRDILVALARNGYWENANAMKDKRVQKLVDGLVSAGVASKMKRSDVCEGSALEGMGTDHDLVLPSSQTLRCFILDTYPELFAADAVEGTIRRSRSLSDLRL